MFHFTSKAAFLRYTTAFAQLHGPAVASLVCLRCGFQGRGRISFPDGIATHADNACYGIIRPWDLPLAQLAEREAAQLKPTNTTLHGP